jgi:hypothetical protein
VDLAKAGKMFKDIKELMDTVYWDKGLKMRAIYTILKKVKSEENANDQRGKKTKKTRGLAIQTPLWPPPLKKTTKQTSGTLLQSMRQHMAPSATSSMPV